MHIRFVEDVRAGHHVIHQAGQVVDVPGPAAAELIRRGVAVEPDQARVRQAVSPAQADARKRG